MSGHYYGGGNVYNVGTYSYYIGKYVYVLVGIYITSKSNS